MKLERPPPTNLNHEPPYPNETDLVMFSLSHPDWTGHLRHRECEIEVPHKIEDCGLWQESQGE
jgi:hypothetical protein